jgi:hypothetical protein
MSTHAAELLADGTCVLRDGDVERWRTTLDFAAARSGNPFAEALIWERADRVVAAAGDRVYLLELETGSVCATLELGADRFGYLVLVSADELLLVLGWTDVRLYDRTAALRWHARDVAIDGITFAELEAEQLRLHAEMDPPGGWFAVTLDLGTGRELERRPALLPGYVGIYGQGSEPP